MTSDCGSDHKNVKTGDSSGFCVYLSLVLYSKMRAAKGKEMGRVGGGAYLYFTPCISYVREVQKKI